MELKLVIAKGEPKGKVIAIVKDSTIIGREPDSDVVIASPKVSRKHCRIDIAGKRVTITDLGSGNGTFVNGNKVTTVNLTPGDKVSVGPLGFIVEIDGQGVPAAAGAKAASTPASAAGPQDIHDFLASLEHGEAQADAPGASGDVIELSEEDLLGDGDNKK